MEKVLFLICIPAVLTLLTFQSVEGCSCIQDPLLDQYKKSDFVFIGKLVNKTVENSIDEFGEPDPDADKNYVVQVLKVYKGDNLVKRTEHIRTEGTASLCGVNLDVDQVYIFNGFKTMSTEGEQLLEITVCSMMLIFPITPQMTSFVEGTLVVVQSIACVNERTC